MSSRLTLRTQLTLPCVVLALALAALLSLLSYRAGKAEVDNLSGQLLVETVNRIAQVVDRHVAGSAAVLEAAFPRGVPAPAPAAVVPRRAGQHGAMVARYAGDEFVILLESVDQRRDALVVQAHLDAALREPMAALAGRDASDLLVGAAFGLAQYPEDGQDVETLIKRADADMYRHKAGR